MNETVKTAGASYNEESVIFSNQKPEPKFAVDLQVYLECNIKNSPVRATANVLGWQRPKHLMITFPLVDNRTLRAPDDVDLIVRYLLNGTVYGFTTKVIHKQQDPFPMWVLNFPAVVQTKTLRRSPRINIALPVTGTDGNQYRTIDLSAHGALLATNSSLSLGERLRISFILPDGSKIDDLFADVVRVQQSREETLVGVNFDEQNKEQVGTIANYLYGRQFADGINLI